MNPSDELTVEQLDAINQVCVDFQSAWREGRQPGLAEYRDRVAPELRGHLGQRLQAIIDELRASEAEAPDTRAPDLQAFQPNLPRSRRIGKYKLLQKIGEGGMGDVWVAEQTEGVQRTIAIKFVKLGLNSRQVLARFEHERQALAMMDHPNIAKVFDAGTDYPDSVLGDQAKEEGAGIPYFVMELVKGVPITEYCDQAQLTPAQRLELFIPVCQAVQHAHQKGIVHRDLKPSNVLIGLYDGKPVPKVIDFGVAKALHAKLTDKTMHTAIGGTIGTLLYMAPEQAGSDNLDIDTRADIYSLGVLLYELLTGGSPFSTQELGKIAYHEMVRHIKEVDPPKPSTRLSELGRSGAPSRTDGAAGPARLAGPASSLASIAAQRKTEPAKLSKLVSGDLDWIVMKCLEKDRGRRYDTATQLGQDLERFLGNEPVQAGPPSAAYRIRKFVRRNQGSVIAATLLLLAMIAGIIGTSIGLVTAERARAAEEFQRGLAEANEKKATQAADEALKALAAEAAATKKALAAAAAERQAKVTAQKRLGQIQKSTDLLASMFTDIDPLKEAKGGPGLREQLAQRLEQIANDLDAEAIDDPATLARLQDFLGTTLISVGNPKKAIALLTGVRSMREATLGPDHADTLTTMNNLAQAYHADGQLSKALALFEETLTKRKAKLGPDDPATLVSMNNLALAYQSNGQLAKALPLLEETLAKRKSKFGPDNPNTLISTNNLAQAYHENRQFAKALPLFEETMIKLTAQLGPDHANTLVSMNNLATAYQEAGQLSKALPLYEEALAKCKDKLGPDHPETLVSMNNLAGAYRTAGRLTKALPLYEEALGKCQAKLGLDHPKTLICMNNLAFAYIADGQSARALPLYEETLAKRKAKLGPDHPDTLMSMNNLADAYRAAGQLAKATQLHEETLAARQAKLGPNHPHTLISMTNLAVTHLYAKKSNEGIAILKEVLAVKRKELGTADPRFAEELAVTGFELLMHEQHAAAEPLLRECLQIRMNSQVDPWTRFNTKAFLGGSLLGQKRYPEAETLLQEGYHGMKEREKAMPRGGAGELKLAERFLLQLFEAAYEKKETKLPGTLTDAKHVQTHDLKLSKGKPVVIDMESKAFDTYLKLENAKGETLAENDDIDYGAKNLNSRILFTPGEDGTYRLIARSYQNEGRGQYTISVREFVSKRSP